MAKKNDETPGRSSNHPRPLREDLDQTGQERERNQSDKRSGMDEDDEVE